MSCEWAAVQSVPIEGLEPEITEWQPIETAPKDREVLLLYLWSHHKKPRVTSGRWLSHARAWTAEPWGRAILATHWMPLPDPPQK